MTYQEQNETIAVLCGYWKDTENRWHRSSGAYRNVPNYVNDLDAMHEAEKTLGNKQDVYEFNLDAVSEHYSYCATAEQRAEAFLKTLGKWKE